MKNLKKCGTSAIITWPVEWHPIHMVLPADSHNHANVSTHLKHGNKTFAVQRRRLLADAQNKGIINIRDLEYIGGATINETMYRFNCYDTKDAKTGLCHLLNEECDCEGDKRIINFEYEGEKKAKGKYFNAKVTGVLQCVDGQYHPLVDIDVTQKVGTAAHSTVRRRRRLLQSGAAGC